MYQEEFLGLILEQVSYTLILKEPSRKLDTA